MSRIKPLSIETHIIKNSGAFKAAGPRMQFSLRKNPADYGLPALKHIEVLSKESAPVWAGLLDLPQHDLT